MKSSIVSSALTSSKNSLWRSIMNLVIAWILHAGLFALFGHFMPHYSPSGTSWPCHKPLVSHVRFLYHSLSFLYACASLQGCRRIYLNGIDSHTSVFGHGLANGMRWWNRDAFFLAISYLPFLYISWWAFIDLTFWSFLLWGGHLSSPRIDMGIFPLPGLIDQGRRSNIE